MVVQTGKASRLLGNLRWYRIGFGFFWATVFSVTLSFEFDRTVSFTTDLVQQAFTVITIIGIAWYLHRCPELKPRHAVLAGLTLAAGLLCYYMLLPYQDGFLAILMTGMLLGISSGSFLMFWQDFFASEGASSSVLYIPLSAVLSVLLCLAIKILLPVSLVPAASIALVVFATVSLFLSLREIHPYEIVHMTRKHIKELATKMWKPVFCVCAVGFVWRLVTAVVAAPDFSLAYGVLLGVGLAALVVAGIELFSEAGFDILRIYQVLFPVLSGAFLIPVLFGTWLAPFLTSVVMFGFEVTNLLLIVMCAVVAADRSFSATTVYAFCIPPTLISMEFGAGVGTILNQTNASDIVLTSTIVILCLYALSSGLLLASWIQRKTRQDDVAAQSENTPRDQGNGPMGKLAATEKTGVAPSALETALALLCEVDPLTDREKEVVRLMLCGNNVPGISRRLFISENTVRGHLKNIYRKAEVHSRQELIETISLLTD